MCKAAIVYLDRTLEKTIIPLIRKQFRKNLLPLFYICFKSAIIKLRKSVGLLT